MNLRHLDVLHALLMLNGQAWMMLWLAGSTRLIVKFWGWIARVSVGRAPLLAITTESLK
jgi:predicted transcriptional regulator